MMDNPLRNGKLIWPMIVIIFVIVLLYSRGFLFYNSVFESQITTEPMFSNEKAMLYGQEEPGLLQELDKEFPAKDRPLVLPAYNWPPFNIKKKGEKWAGADIEITQAILNNMGYKVKWIEFTFARALEEMKSPKYPGMAPCVVGGGREAYIIFSDPVSSIFSVLWKNKEDPFTWATYGDLKGKTIGASYYHYGAGFFKAAESGMFKLDMVASKNPELIHFKKQIEGKTDLFISELNLGLYLRYKYAPAFDKVDYDPRGVGPVRPFCFAVSREYFKGREDKLHEFINDFNLHLKAFSMEGKSRTIFEKYYMKIQTDDEGRVVIPLKE